MSSGPWPSLWGGEKVKELFKLSSFTPGKHSDILVKNRKKESYHDICLLSQMYHLPEGPEVAG